MDYSGSANTVGGKDLGWLTVSDEDDEDDKDEDNHRINYSGSANRW